MVLFSNFRNHKLYLFGITSIHSTTISVKESKKIKEPTTCTFAVATCPSVSSLSIVPVGKYGTIAVNDRANNLDEIEFNLK